MSGVGLGLCDEEPCLVVFVAGDPARLRDRLPETVDGYAVDLRVSGDFRVQDSL